MQITNISEAKAHLSALIEKVLAGEDVIIGKAGKPVAKLVRYEHNRQPRHPGALKGKIKIADDFDTLPEDIAKAFEMLSITSDHAYAVGNLPKHHRDPFDRILIAQAKLEGLTVVTHDPVFKKYQIPVL